VKNVRPRVAALAALAVVALVAGGAFALGAARGHSSHEQAAEKAGGDEIAQLRKSGALPGRFEGFEKNHKVAEISNGPAQEDYANEAYPAHAIAFAQTRNAMRAADRVEARGQAKRRGDWQEIGPTTLNVDSLGTQTYGPATQWSGRITALAVAHPCTPERCRLYVAAAGGGIWTTGDALDHRPDWTPIDDGLDSNAIGTIVIDPSDPSGSTLYVGTGEPNGSSDSEAGVGLYKSTDFGRHWALLPGSVAVSKDRSIGALAIDPANPDHLVMGTDVARHGLSSEYGGRLTPPGAPPIGIYQSLDGGGTWSPALIEPQDAVNPGTPNGSDFFRGGVTSIQYDPTHPGVFYASMFDYGLWRTTDNGSSFENIFADTTGDPIGIRYEFAPAARANGKTRLYLGAGYNEETDANGNLTAASELFRVDDALQPASALTTGGTNGGWTLLSSPTPGDPGYASFDFCEGQCSYDMFVASPAGHPGEVVIGGSMQYGELPLYPGPDQSNGRAVQLSTDAGRSFTDLTGDAQNLRGTLAHFQDMHPDQHAIAFDPQNPDIMFVGSDGGLVRTSGDYVDNSAACDTRSLTGVALDQCHHWLSRIPTVLSTLNAGLATLQFQSLSVDPQQPLSDLLGGTQDNGTLAFTGSTTWFLPVTGDGGDSGIDPQRPRTRFHTYTSNQVDVNFQGNKPETWDWIGDPLLFSGEPSAFYAPMLQDPVTGGQIFAGEDHVWRTQDSGGDRAFLDAHCNTTGLFGTSDQLFTGNCGDWVPIGDPLVSSAGTKGGGWVAALARGTDRRTLWVGTRLGRIYISHNADAADPGAVTFTRIDTASTPTRFPSGISVDPTNRNHAIITFSGYNAYATAAGTATGHVFDVVYHPGSGTATWTNLDYDLGDQPILDVVFDQPTGDIYVSTDWGVDRLEQGDTTWQPAGDGLPMAAVYGLTLNTFGEHDQKRVIYAATHGRGAWRLTLPGPNR
jgi:hypothetical protein